MDKKKFEEAEVEVIRFNSDIKTGMGLGFGGDGEESDPSASLPITSGEDDNGRQ